MKRVGGAKSGFTIVELLIVIVVIGILAAITVVAYSGVRAKANDAKRKSDVSNIVKAMMLYAQDAQGNMMNATSGCGKNGSGYWMGEYGNPSLQKCLVDAGYPQMVNIQDPSGCDGDNVCPQTLVPRYMKLNCKQAGVDKVYIMAYLESQSQNKNFIESICSPATATGFGDVSFWDERYGINYAVQAQ